MPLLPSPRLRRLQWLLIGLSVVHGAELVRHGHPLAGAGTLAAAGMALWLWRDGGQGRPGQPRRLVVTADGRLFLHLHGGAVEQADLAPSSLRLGRHLLLVLHCGKYRYRLLLGPDNLDGPDLSALQRRLPRGQGG